MLDIRFTSCTPEEKEDADRQKITNLLDNPDWHWLKARIADEGLCWSQVFELVAAAT